MSQLRWWLLILGVAFFAGLTLWELRRPRQARKGDAPPPEPARPREPPLQLPEMHAVGPMASRSLPTVELPEDTGQFPVLEPAPAPAEEAAPGAPEPQPATPEEPDYVIEARPVVEWPPDQERHIVALRLVAMQPERFAGRSLRQALAAEGFVLGQFDIFHKPDEAQRAILSAASLTRPGTFDADTMDSQHFGGLSLFAVLPGPMSPPEAFEELVTTARNLNDRLCGVLQDEGGTPLTPARIASLRARLAAGAPA
ncbi:MAG TPA: cell division protein ZipA C-terminal FtsZ-binding domain-containing protein [Steroidobacteraceae bacterium]|nr:cell division protein ZipA C-terminal FtsZ-binding domain-containing protein [Steroidobacteraceae bacterium]